MGIPSVKKTALASMVALAVLLLPVVASAQEAPGVSQSAPQGLTLDRSKQTIRSVHRIDLTRDFATMPLHRGTAGGETVWFVITDVSDPAMARRLGVNFSPKLRNAPRGCPACVQTVRTSDPVLGQAPVEFEGAPDFNPTRTLVPGPTIVPPQSFSAGSTGRPGYSPFVQVGGSNVVFNAPIIATGEGPFDVTTHTNTHDRTLGIDTQRMTTDHLFIRGFANGEPIFYLSFDVSEELTATVERSTFVPALDRLSRPNGGGESDSARASIFQFVNSRRGLEAPSAFGATDRRGRPGSDPRPGRRPPGHRRGDLQPGGARGLPAGSGRQQRLRRLPDQQPPPRPSRVQPGLGPGQRPLHAGGGEPEAERAEDRLQRDPAPGRQGARDLADRGAARLDQRRDQLPGARVR